MHHPDQLNVKFNGPTDYLLVIFPAAFTKLSK